MNVESLYHEESYIKAPLLLIQAFNGGQLGEAGIAVEEALQSGASGDTICNSRTG